jgi:hypothetical protein
VSNPSWLEPIKTKLAADQITPDWTVGGLPCCDERCARFDGKRCEVSGFRPHYFCEPAVLAMAAELEEHAKKPAGPGPLRAEAAALLAGGGP